MINHVYLIKLHDRSKAIEVRDHIRDDMRKIPYIYEYEVEIDFRGTTGSFDVIEICRFLTMEDFQNFGTHPDHENTRRYLSKVAKITCKVDYESART